MNFESNLASPTTGDISNSYRDNADLPILSHTYVVYGINYRRTQAEALHNVGHQLEAMLSYISTRQTGSDRPGARQLGPEEDGQRGYVGTLRHPWPGEQDFEQRVAAQWYTYWWAFVGDWDGSVRSGLGLYASTPAAARGEGAPFTHDASRATIAARHVGGLRSNPRR